MNESVGVERAFAGASIISSSTDEEAMSYFNGNMPQGMKLLNAVCETGSRKSGELAIAFRLDSRFINPVGLIGGGYVAQMLDQAATYACSFVTGKASPSLDLKVSFIAPAKPGTFTAIGRAVKAGTSIGFLEAKLFDASERLIATGAVTAQLLPISKLAGSAERKLVALPPAADRGLRQGC